MNRTKINIVMTSNTKKTVAVVGGGFAGINFINAIAKNENFDIILVDTNNYHFFPPLLYQVAASFIEASNISYPFRRMFQQKENIRFHLGSLIRVNTDTNTIETDTGIIPYDYLVLAVGTEPNYFGMDNVKQKSLPMKTINDALNLRNHLLTSMENAVRESIPSEREKYLNIVIAGGGPTGVEIAGVLAEMEKYISEKEYPEIKNLKGHIYLIDTSNALLGPMSKTAQKEAEKVLTNLGVNIKLNVSVKDYVDGKVVLSNEESIPTNTLIWTSGVVGKEISGLPLDSLGKGKRILVDQFNKVKGTKNVFAIGDISFQTSDSNYPNGHPQLAQVAIQQGKLLAENIPKNLNGKILKEFTYNDRGSMAIISKYKAVADLSKFSFKGYFAWLIWLFIHIMPIASFRNKIKLAYNWFWAFISNNPTLRLIIRPTKKINP